MIHIFERLVSLQEKGTIFGWCLRAKWDAVLKMPEFEFSVTMPDGEKGVYHCRHSEGLHCVSEEILEQLENDPRFFPRELVRQRALSKMLSQSAKEL